MSKARLPLTMNMVCCNVSVLAPPGRGERSTHGRVLHRGQGDAAQFGRDAQRLRVNDAAHTARHKDRKLRNRFTVAHHVHLFNLIHSPAVPLTLCNSLRPLLLRCPVLASPNT